MMMFVHSILTTAIFWSFAHCLSFSLPWYTIEPVSFVRSSRAIETINYRLPDDVVPNSYKIKLIPDLDSREFTFEGVSEINISVKKPTKQITLHAKNLHIDDMIHLECSHQRLALDISHFNVLSKSQDAVTDFLTLFLDEEVSDGSECNLILTYSSIEGNSHVGQGFYATSYSENSITKRMASTQFQTIYARSAFPCWDEPALKANFTISIEHNKKYVALSNMHVERNEESSLDPSRTTTYFAQSPKMSTYTVAFAVGDFAKATGNDAEIFRVWSRKADFHIGKYVEENGSRILMLLEYYLLFTYEGQGFDKMEILAIPGFNGAMENWGLITWAESELLLQDDSILAEQHRFELLAHELIHQWFGNLVSPSWWNHIWLNEGFATYFHHIIIQQIEPQWRMMDRFVTETLQSMAFGYDSVKKKSHAMDLDRNSPHDIELSFDQISYHKAACVIRMISHVIGEQTFRARLIIYIATHAFKSATSEDLLLALAGNDGDLLGFMRNWVSVPGYPVINVTRNYITGITTITQSRYLEGEDRSSTERYWIPLNYATEDNLNFVDTSVTNWLRPSENSVEIDHLSKDKFVIFNKQQFGYYRVNYDERNWRLISNYLRTENHENINAANRAQLIDDAFHLAEVNQLKFNIALSLIGYLKNENDYVVWNAAWRSISIAYSYARHSNYAANFMNYILYLSSGVFDRLLSDQMNKNYLAQIWSNDYAYWRCQFGSGFCMSRASLELKNWLNKFGQNPIIPLPPRWVLCGGGRLVNHKILDILWASYLNEGKEEFFQAIACTSDHMIFKNHLLKCIHNNNVKRINFSKAFQLFISVANGNNLNVVLDFMIQHHKEIMALERYSNDDLKADLMLLGKKLNNANQLEKLRTFCMTNRDALNSTAVKIVRNSERTIKVFDERSKEFTEFFEKDVYDESLYLNQKIRHKSVRNLISDPMISRILRN